MRWMLAVVVMLGCATQAQAELHTEPVEYRHGDTVLEGYLAYDSHLEKPGPGVLVVHEWKGLNEYAKHRAEQLAQLGYTALAVDMYGKGIQAKDHEEAAKLSGIYRSDRQLMRARIQAGLDVLSHHPLVDARRIGAIGYCFGGTTVLELARSGADVAGVVSFHGGLATPSPASPGTVKARVLVCHGAADSYVSAEEVAAFEAEMQQAGVEYRLIRYDGAVHSFTVPDAGNDSSRGVAYHPEADRASWEAMRRFFEEVLGAPSSVAALSTQVE